jgi:hypothetical protein
MELLLTTVFNTDILFATGTLAKDLKGEALNIKLNLSIVKLAPI